MKQSKACYKAIDLFAGIGGIRKGFDNAFADEISTVFVSEWDLNAQKTYAANFSTPSENGETKIYGDITLKETKDKIPEFDICLAGFPCQAFSMAGKHQGFEDDYRGICRGTLFKDVAEICDTHKPKVIFCENVKGLKIHDKGNTLRIICDTFSKIGPGYDVFYEILNSRNYGVPQNRERIYIVCFRKDLKVKQFEFPPGNKKSKCIDDIVEQDPVSVKYYLSETYLNTLIKHKTRHKKAGHGFGYQIKDRSDVANAIVCGGMGRERNLIIDDRLTDYTPVTNIKGPVNREGIRKMTPREWARLQGFPDDYKLILSDTQLYKQLGNTVTVPVVEEIAKKIKSILETDIPSDNNGCR